MVCLEAFSLTRKPFPLFLASSGLLFVLAVAVLWPLHLLRYVMVLKLQSCMPE